MKGPSEKGELFAVLEYMKGGLVVTHPCAPPSKNRVLYAIPMYSFSCVLVVVCVVRKPCPCLSHSRRRDLINLVLLHSYYKGRGGGDFVNTRRTLGGTSVTSFFV